ncbi:MAG: hypothetical protein QXS24_00880 [Desulfurococcaceae archaeon]
MKLDFLRHIVNPLVEKYVEKGVLNPKDAIELKRLVHSAEEKYRFSIYNGELLNLVNYFKSSDFRNLISFMRSCNANELLSEILEKVKEAYGEYPEVIEALNTALQEVSVKKETGVIGEVFDMEALVKVVKEVLDPREVTINKNAVKALLNEGVEFKINVFKQRVKIEVKFDKSIDKRTLSALFNKVAGIAEKAVRVRL